MEPNRHIGLVSIIGTIAGILGGLVGFFISKYIEIHNFEKSLNYDMLRFTTELAQDFYSSKEDLYREVRTSIEACDDLYQPWGGKFDHDQLNQYLNFFENLGYFYREGVLELKWIDQFFGAYIVEASAHDDVQKYIKNFQNNAQENAFTNFQDLAKALEKAAPELKVVADTTSQACVKKKSQNGKSKRN